MNADLPLDEKSGVGQSEAQTLGTLLEGRQHDGRIGNGAIFMEMMLGHKERIVTEPVGKFRLGDDLLIELRHSARLRWIVILDRENGQAYPGFGRNETDLTHYVFSAPASKAPVMRLISPCV